MGRKLSLEEINGRTGADKLFPGKLHDMLDYAENEAMEHIVSWTSDGKAFAIHKPKELVQLLPMFFGHSKYRSFHRQLNMWSYRRLVDGPNKGAFMHPYFIKGQKEQCKTISRHKFRTLPSETNAHSEKTTLRTEPRLFKQAMPLDSENISNSDILGDILGEAMTVMQRSPSQVSIESNEIEKSSALLPQLSMGSNYQSMFHSSTCFEQSAQPIYTAPYPFECESQSTIREDEALTFAGKVFHPIGW